MEYKKLKYTTTQHNTIELNTIKHNKTGESGTEPTINQ